MFLPSSKTSHDLLNPFRALSNCSVPGAPTIDGVAAEAGGDLRIAVLPPATDGGSSITAYFILGLPTNGGPILAAGGSLGQPAVDDAAATKTWGWLALGSSSSSSSSNPTTGRRAVSGQCMWPTGEGGVWWAKQQRADACRDALLDCRASSRCRLAAGSLAGPTASSPGASTPRAEAQTAHPLSSPRHTGVLPLLSSGFAAPGWHGHSPCSHQPVPLPCSGPSPPRPPPAAGGRQPTTGYCGGGPDLPAACLPCARLPSSAGRPLLWCQV